jgi:hypothetical protein
MAGDNDISPLKTLADVLRERKNVYQDKEYNAHANKRILKYLSAC